MIPSSSYCVILKEVSSRTKSCLWGKWKIKEAAEVSGYFMIPHCFLRTDNIRWTQRRIANSTWLECRRKSASSVHVERLIELTATRSHTITASTPPDTRLCSYRTWVFLTSAHKCNISDRPNNNNYFYSSNWNRNKSGTLMIQQVNVYFQRPISIPLEKKTLTHIAWSRMCTWSEQISHWVHRVCPHWGWKMGLIGEGRGGKFSQNN